MKILDGKKTSQEIQKEIALEVEQIKNNGGKVPHLAAILVGNNGASMTYVNNKVTACERVGFNSTLVTLPEDTSQEELLTEIQKLNQNPDIDGFIVQLPLPKHINEQKVLLAIDPDKDVDGFHPTNFGRMALELEAFIPATPFGILELLKRHNISTEGKNVVVIGRSDIAGRPMSILLSQKNWNATVTLTHSRTKNLSEYTQKADIVIVALGKPLFLKADMVKNDVVIIDVGITRVEDAKSSKGYRIAGDVDFEDVKDKASYITPVPGGVGPMTIAMLMKNTLLARKRKR
ncbi:bifunctional methylenetetrahydrofolate dehydrogenase/methenyltetrahydrofolate cyclohydrolase FolD [Capnocytophaga catalasegens]|uniref:Bifunctional protein FolD n=1 Tax=Capnocytophaga catalasegens TaxID=1004260 RepID=A0AAV5AXM6_9FLAO|nr:bifunctional methylenetetrahydrofolate dehydrogenase/methenyltetrahydrofolate cyclohydrolase FolD [Capnocytophaga catalasegens]GIZ16078.1 bifunctional protein FolD [Capnocytophaga catalasegens]GJM50237.1 bifunctional protein FolD [Capnocytophaga catalasegens]GJM53468.1 bifunctional protein FolD [Capnocytophaga catalasegens]